MLLMRTTKTAFCLQTKAILCVLICVLAKFHESYFNNSSNWTLGIDFSNKFRLKNVDPYAHYAACWFPLKGTNTQYKGHMGQKCSD